MTTPDSTSERLCPECGSTFERVFFMGRSSDLLYWRCKQCHRNYCDRCQSPPPGYVSVEEVVAAMKAEPKPFTTAGIIERAELIQRVEQLAERKV